MSTLLYRAAGAALLGFFWWKALDPPSLLRIWIFGLWGTAAFVLFWMFSAHDQFLKRQGPDDDHH